MRRRGATLAPRPQFGHGVVVSLERAGTGGTRALPHTLIGCYHPSRQNTNTGKLTAQMMEAVFRKAAALARAPRA
jgi:uracil-DNA glycosylase